MGATSHHLFLSNLTTNDVVAPKKIPQTSINNMLTANFFFNLCPFKAIMCAGNCYETQRGSTMSSIFFLHQGRPR